MLAIIRKGWYNCQQQALQYVDVERRDRISQEPRDSANTSLTAVTTAEVQSDPEASAPSTVTKKAATRYKVWGGRIFRFNLQNFRPNAGFSIRRFSIVEAALLLMLALLTSRGLGVVRQVIFNAIFGTGPEANAYYAAFQLPDTLFNLIAGGALSHAFIPVFLSYEKNKGQYEAWRLTSLVFNVLLVVLAIATIVGEFLTPAFVSHLLVPGYSASEQALTTELTRIMLLQPLILGLGTIATAILNSKRQFLLPALSIAVYNFGLIGGLLVTKFVPEVGIYGPTYGILVAVLLTVLVQFPGIIKQGVRYSFVWDLRNPGLWDVMRLLGPNTLALGIAYIGFIVNTAFTSYLPDPASLAALHNALLLQGLPAALISQAIGQAILPHLSLQAAAGQYTRLYQTSLKVMGVSILLTIPAAIVLIFLGKPAIHILFEHGAFDKHSSDLTNLALMGFAIALPGMSAGDLISRGFYALKDARTPLFTNIFSLVSRYGLIVLLLNIMNGPFVILAIPLALAGSTTAEALLLGLILLWQLKKKMKTDKGMLRLLRRRLYKNTIA